MSIRNGMQIVIKYNATGEIVKEAIKNDIKMLYMWFSFFLKLLDCINLNVIGLNTVNGLYFDGSLIKSPVSMHDNGM
jgi:hypothetical protein